MMGSVHGAVTGCRAKYRPAVSRSYARRNGRDTRPVRFAASEGAMHAVTRSTRRILGLTAAAIGVIASAVVLAQSPPQWMPVTDERLLEPAPGDWMSYRRTYDVTAFSPLRQIDRSTVRQLQPVWTYSMRDNRRWLATPIVANGLMYVPEGSGRVVAFDAVTGEVVWVHDRQFPDDVSVS